MEASNDLTLHLLGFARARASAPALMAPGRKPTSFAALAARTERVAGQLRGWGIDRGDVVAWVIGDRPQAAAALAVVPASATLMLLPAYANPQELAETLRRVGPKAIVVPPSSESAARMAAQLDLAVMSARDDGSGEAGAFELGLEVPRSSLERPRRHSSSWALIGATSGTTGRPKIFSHGHRQVIATALASGERLGHGPDDISGHVMPLHLSGGIRNGFFQTLLCGGAVNVLPEAGVDALIDAIGAGDVTYTSAAFTILGELLARLEGGARYARGRLRAIRVASGRMAPAEMDRLERALGVPVVTGLACSEAGSVAQQSPREPRVRGSVGRPVATEVRLVDASGNDVAHGEAGEILIRGPQVFDGYIDDDALNATAFTDGWFRMGDLARFDADGQLHVVGRVKDLINRGGEKISPAEIDAAMHALPEIADAATFGIPHARLGEEVVAAVVLAQGAVASEGDILDRLRATLGARRTPRRLWFVASLPRGDGGKLRRYDLPSWVGIHDFAADEPSGVDPHRSAVEVALGALWQHVLGVASVQGDQRFRALGGDDGKAGVLLAQVRAVFDVEIPAEALDGDAGTLAGMARRIERGAEGHGPTGTGPDDAGGARTRADEA